MKNYSTLMTLMGRIFTDRFQAIIENQSDQSNQCAIF